jgi:hypothetical protein
VCLEDKSILSRSGTHLFGVAAVPTQKIEHLLGLAVHFGHLEEQII